MEFSLKAKADNDGGYSHVTIKDSLGTLEEKESFDTAGQSTGLSYKTNDSDWIVEDAIEQNLYDDIEDKDDLVVLSNNLDFKGIYDTNVSSQSISYIVVKEDITPSFDNVLGFAEFYDDNQNNIIDEGELFVDYFGDDSLIGDKNTTIDDDKLDIYKVLYETNDFEKIDSITLININ